MSENLQIYRRITSMEPMLPSSSMSELSELTAEIYKKSGELKASLPSHLVRTEVAQLVREMNSYYSNLIEGHKTLPRDIERALKEEFAEGEDDRRNQILSVAHVRVEEAMMARLRTETDISVYSSDFVTWLHNEFYNHLPEEEWFTTSRDGKRYPLTPGELRSYNVDVGRHIPPDFPELPKFLARYENVYSSAKVHATNRPLAIAASHHRLAWIHPFGDGNGRVARLHSQAALALEGLDGDGLWTLSRGLARNRSSYYEHLQLADRQRQDDYDGKGNLSDRYLSKFCVFFLKQILDQMDFMIGLTAPFALQERVEKYFQFVRTDLDGREREKFMKLIKALCLRGELARGEVPAILGLKGTASREVIRRALEEGFISTVSEKGALRVAFPNKVVEYYFPGLFTDLPVDR